MMDVSSLILLVSKTIVIFLIVLCLFMASIIDIRYTRIDLKTVIILFTLVPIYLVLSNANMVIASFTFLFSLVVFLGLWMISRGGFGLGDVLVLSAIGWLIGDFEILKAFLVTMGIICIPWALFWIWKYRRDPFKKTIWSGISKKILNVDDLRPGMVLAADKFMRGLTERDIDQLRSNGFETVNVKQPMPFIPVIFVVTAIYAIAPGLLLSF